ncbi:hypothetical protein [Butyrivibrio sp. AD3002]|uniref:hypothetical protein n=1 Tax=Butyrivibrio sp. AD3002 TaxID=1280670 RepID=UPI0003B5B671|nr:hypothetical protein [Butyrivibrio sp. AD3002]
MKNRLISSIMMATLALELVACGGAKDTDTSKEEAAVTEQQEDAAEEASSEEASAEEEASEETAESAENTEIANPWRECTEEEANAACPRLFKAPEDAVVNGWSLMDANSNENGVPGALVELDFRMEGMDYTARAQYGVGENEDISGIYYDWDNTEDITLANWGEGHMPAKLSRHIEDGWMIDLCTWYDIEIGIAYSLSVEAEDLEGFDLQAIAEQMYSAENEPYVGEPEEGESQGQVQSFEGQYYAGRGNLSITGQGDDTYLIEVWWGSSASEHSEWVMHGTYNESTQTITYSDCEKHDFVLNENGEVDTDDIAYTDGSGSIKIVDDSSIIWTDDQDHIADDLTLER